MKSKKLKSEYSKLLKWLSDSREHDIEESEISEILEDYYYYYYDKEKNDDDKLILEITKEEAKGILGCLIRTSAKGSNLTIGIELEDLIANFIKK